jgi:hypothetical protein
MTELTNSGRLEGYQKQHQMVLDALAEKGATATP